MRGKNFGSSALPGRYTFGAFYDTRDFDKLSDQTKQNSGNYGLYWILEQMIYREENTSDQGLTPWTAIAISPDETINTFPFFISGGLVYKGLIPDRGNDRAVFGFAYGSISEDLDDRDYEFMTEISYLIQAKPWLEIQPDIQWIVNPGGRSDISNALVIGMQTVVDF